MPRQVLIPTYRIVFPYTINGFTHHMAHFLGVTPSADPSGFDTVPRGGAAAVGVKTAMDRLQVIWAPFFGSVNSSFGACVLQQMVAGSWVPIWTDTAVGAPGGGAVANSYGWELVLSMYSTSHEKMKVVVPETTVAQLVKYGPGYAYAGTTLTVVEDYANLGGVANAAGPYNWLQARNATFVGSFLSWSSGVSRHWARKRGL